MKMESSIQLSSKQKKSINLISKLSNIFGRVVFLAIGKYINPTRYRQIIETESAKDR